jgi:hypothetical protein
MSDVVIARSIMIVLIMEAMDALLSESAYMLLVRKVKSYSHQSEAEQDVEHYFFAACNLDLPNDSKRH